MTSREVVEVHRQAGRRFCVNGLESFVRERGAGEAVVCLHGVPASCFLYRKVLDELARHGLRGIAFDLPGLGLADRPVDFDYRWSGLGRFCAAAVEALALERFHLVVHDIGGPVGFELLAALPQRVVSLTILNTVVEVDRFRRPWAMQPFAIAGLGELWLASLTKPFFRILMRRQGFASSAAVPSAELDAYVDLLKRGDGGRAFLRIMRGFERTPEKSALYTHALQSFRGPKQVVWGEYDPALTRGHHGEQARRAAGVERIHLVPAKHFLQEDQAPAVAKHVATLAARA